MMRAARLLPVLALAEVLVFAIVALAISFWWALLLSVVTSLLGALLLQRAKVEVGAAFRQARSGRRPDPHAVVAALAQSGAGLFLVFPGFLTDLLGFALLVPAVRGRLVATFASRLGVGVGRTGPRIVDLDPDEFVVRPQAPRALDRADLPTRL